MHEVDWKKDGETGCLMTIIQAAGITLAAVVTVIFGSIAIVALW